MAETKHTLSLLRRQKKAFRRDIHRLARVLARLLPPRVALVLAPRPVRRSIRNVTKFEIGGNITRSIILALPNVHVGEINIKAIVGGIVIIIVVINVATSMTPNPGMNALQAFMRGDSYHLDAVITPFRVVNPSDKACSKFALDFANHLAHAVVNSDPQGVAIWMPDQVAGAVAQDSKDGMTLKQFAGEHQIDVLFYGDIECDAQKATVRPYVIAPALFYRGAPEMEGFYNFDDMTDPLQVELGANSLEQAAREQAARISTLIDVGRGFRLLAANKADEFLQATTMFQRLAEAGSIADRHGLAMLQYLTGKAQLAGAADKCNIVDHNLLQQAENSFSKSLLNEPEFALALVQLGNVSVYQARALPESSVVQIEAVLSKGLSRFQRALDARVQPADSLANAIATIGKAQARIVMYDAYPANNERQQMLVDAVAGLNEVVRKFDGAGAGKEIKSAVALAYALLGDLQRAGFNDERALSSYVKVAALTEDRRLQTAVAQSMAELYTVRGDACAASQQYLTAAQGACEADSRKYAMQAKQMQYYCQQTNDARSR